MIYHSPGENAAGKTPIRVFPDLAQVVAGNTNAATGSVPHRRPAEPATVDCYSEFLPTAAYAAPLHFRLTARDGNPAGGGVAHDDTTLTLAPGTDPFRVTSQAAATSVNAGDPLTVTWSVAGTNAAPVSTANVRITLSTDGGQTFPTVLSASTPNDGSQVVTVPNAATTDGRIKVEAVGNVFFDVNHADVTIVADELVATNDAPDDGATVQYSDALAQTVTISATDADSPGSALTATAPGLPEGLTLLAGAPSANGRTWTVVGETTEVPDLYGVEVTVEDGDGNEATTEFSVDVTEEDAGATYTGPASVTGAAGAASAPVTLSFSVADSPDPTGGDVATATVTFMEGTATLCANVPVVTAGDPRLGSATCAANLSTGATHHVDAVIGGNYQGGGAGDVQVTAASGPVTPGTPGTPGTPAPPAPPAPRHPGRPGVRAGPRQGGQAPAALEVRARLDPAQLPHGRRRVGSRPLHRHAEAAGQGQGQAADRGPRPLHREPGRVEDREGPAHRQGAPGAEEGDVREAHRGRGQRRCAAHGHEEGEAGPAEALIGRPCGW